MNNEELVREKALRKLNAGLYARSVWPEDQAFYMTHSFTLDEDVSPDALKKALDAAIQVWPYMALSVVKQDRTYVLKENGLEFVIRETGERIEPSTEAGNYHAVTICYEGRKLNFYVDHILTDGLGWKMVLETFFYYYFCALDGNEYPVPEGVRTVPDGPAPDEQDDAYMKAPAAMPRGVIAGAAEKNIFHCPEVTGSKDALTVEDCGHYMISVPSEAFMGYARTVGGSPNSALIQIMGQSIQKLHPENRQPMAFWIPVSIRAAMGNTHSLLHQVVPTIWYADPEVLAAGGGAAGINEQIRGHLRDFCAAENIRKQCGMMHMIIEMIRKSVSAGRLGQVMGQKADQEQYSVLASSLGTLAAGEYGSRIHMDAFRVMPGKSLNVYLMETGGNFYVSLSLGAKTDAYAKAAAEYMTQLGMKGVSWREVS